MTFAPYVAKDRFFRDFHFDFHIVNETGQSWYDGSPSQWMPEREWCVSKLMKGMTVVDCGAHHGMLSLIFASAVGPTGKVFSYEALPSNAAVVELNASLNGLENIEVRAVGVGDVQGSVTVSFNASNTVVMTSDLSKDQADEVIQIVRLDDDLAPFVKVDFLKIDVEGHDLNALRGMPRILSQRPIIDLELHNFIFADKVSTLGQILSILQPLGYSWELLTEIGEEPVKIGRCLELQKLLQFANPHLFGVPGLRK
jgi:FkbM family methyltransferase